MTPAHPRRDGIVLEALRKSYGPVEAVRGIDLSISPGETVALLGPNGAGKSTTIDLMLGLTRPDAGTVTAFDLDPAEAVTAGRIGGMLQTGDLIEGVSVRELVLMVASLYPHALSVGEVLKTTGTAAFADQRTTKLSGGQTQRVRFALALVANPDLLVLDEPTAALDVEGRRDFWDSMRAVARSGKTIVFATHYLEEADAFADRIVLMARGRIVADGPATEIKAKAGGRTIHATLPEVRLDELGALPGVTSADRRGEAVVLMCVDSDTALRAFLAAYPAARDIEVRGAGLEEAFLEIVAEDEREMIESMKHATYIRYEVLRTFRNRRFLLFSLALPLVLYLLLASTNRHAKLDGISFPLYFMAGMASWGAMLGIISAGSRISLERQVGWTRQLRITPLKTSSYFAAKVVCGYLTALLTMVLLYLAGTAFGVRLDAAQWASMVGLVLVGLIPFALLGIMFGHLLKPDSLGPAVGGLTALFAVLGGAWGPIATGGALLAVVKFIPSYWLVQSGKVALGGGGGGGGWPVQGWIVIAVWSLVIARLATLAYRRDTARVS